MFWQIIYVLAVPIFMFHEIWSALMTSFKRDIGGFCLNNNIKVNNNKVNNIHKVQRF